MSGKNNRPLSPHISIYKLQTSSLFSIFHRITGFLVFFIIVGLIWFGALIVYCGESLGSFVGFAKDHNAFFCFMFFTILSFFCYHIANGFRHLLWDAGYFLEKKFIVPSAIAVLCITLWGVIAFTFLLFFDF